MHINHEMHQIRFRHELGPRAGRQDTLSMRRFGLSDRDFHAAARQIETIFQAQRQDVEHLRTTHAWIESIPRKLQSYLRSRILAHDPEFIVAQIVSLHESIDEYAAYRATSDKSIVATDDNVMRDIELLRDRCPSDVTRIDAGLLGDLLLDLVDEFAYSENTLARIAIRWSIFFNWLRNRGVIAVNPCEKLAKVIGTKAKDEVRTEWVDRLVAACDTTEERYWLRLMQWTGCRLGEGLSLRVCDVELPKGRITFTETKNARRRANPIYPAIAEHLPTLLLGRHPEDPILRSITRANCYDWLYGLLDRLGIERWSPPWNAFRSTRANQLAADRTISPQDAGMLLGHSATVARRNYLSVQDSLLDRLGGKT